MQRRYEQEAQLSQRDHATLHVIEYFAKSLKFIRSDTVSIPLKLCLYSETFSVKEWRDLETGGS